MRGTVSPVGREGSLKRKCQSYPGALLISNEDPSPKRVKKDPPSDSSDSEVSVFDHTSESDENTDTEVSSESEAGGLFDLEGYLRFTKTLEEAATGETVERSSEVCSETGHQV